MWCQAKGSCSDREDTVFIPSGRNKPKQACRVGGDEGGSTAMAVSSRLENERTPCLVFGLGKGQQQDQSPLMSQSGLER